MRSAIKTTVLLALLSVSAFAQQASAPASTTTPSTQTVAATDPNTPTREQVFALLDAMQMRKLLQELMDNAIPAMMRNMTQQQMQAAAASMNEKQKEMFVDGMSKIEADTLKEISIDDFLNVFVPIYQKHFSTAEINDLITFYRSPTGAKLMSEQGKIAQEGMISTDQMMNLRMEELQAKMGPKIAELMKQVEAAGDKKPAAPAPKSSTTTPATKKPAASSSTTKPPDKP